MNCNGRCKFSACGCLGVVISIILGAIVGILFAFNFIPGIVIAAWIAFGLGVLTLVLVFIATLVSACCHCRALIKCSARNIPCLLVGTFGTIITSIAALSIVLTNAFISVIALVALGAFFVSLMFIGIIAYISCILCELTEN